MTFDLLPLKPTVATTCYGMNDGGYHPTDQATCDNYRKAMTEVVESFKNGGVRTIVVGTPGVVDAGGFFGRPPGDAEYYNKALGALADVAKDVAQKAGVLFADLHSPMMEVMTKSKAKYGDKYRFAGGDGVHPNSNGHLVMAYAFLKALGCHGNIGTITVDLASNQAAATPSHTVDSMSNGKVKLTSTRYPFCFYDKPEEEGATTGIIEFFPL